MNSIAGGDTFTFTRIMTEHGVPTGREWLACPSCDALHQKPKKTVVGDGYCADCGHKLFSHPANSLHRSLAFSVSALVLFIPANFYALVTMSSYGAKNQNHLISGPIDLLQYQMPGVGLLVFLTSIVFPVIFLLGIFTVSACVQTGRFPTFFPSIMRKVQMLDRWAMIDVYILACLVAFVKLADLAQVDPGPGLYCLGGVLVFTLLTTLSFDPAMIWDRYAEHKRTSV